MSTYETDTHISRSDRILVYVGFGLILMLTVMLYVNDIDGFSRLSLYALVLAFIPTSWVWMSGHYSKKFRRMATRHIERANLQPVPVIGEARYAYKGEVVPLAEALGYDI